MLSGCWLLAAGCWLLAAGCWLLVAGCWLLAAGCWLLVSGCWLLVASGQWPVASGQRPVASPGASNVFLTFRFPLSAFRFPEVVGQGGFHGFFGQDGAVAFGGGQSAQGRG